MLTVAVPVLTTDSLTWTCSGEAPARQCLITRGLLPLLAEGSARATDTDTTDEILQVHSLAATGIDMLSTHYIVLLLLALYCTLAASHDLPSDCGVNYCGVLCSACCHAKRCCGCVHTADVWMYGLKATVWVHCRPQ